MRLAAATCATILALAIAAPTALADGTAENRKLRVTLQASSVVTPGSAFEIILVVENLTDRAVRVRSQVCMKTPFGPLCGPVPAPRVLEPHLAVEVAALMLCEEGTPLGDYHVTVEFRAGKETLSIPHTIRVVEG